MSNIYRHGRGRYCVVTECKNTDAVLWRWKHSICDDHLDDDGLPIKRLDCVCLIPLSFHKFPKSDAEKHIWLQAIQRPDYNPNKRAIVCSEHFIDGRPTKAHPYPTENIVNITGSLWQEVQSWKESQETVQPQPQARTVDNFIAATGKGFLNDILKFANKNNVEPTHSNENSQSLVGILENHEANSREYERITADISEVNDNANSNAECQYINDNGETFVYVNENSPEITPTSPDSNVANISSLETHSLRERLFSKPTIVVEEIETKKPITKTNGTQVDTSFFDYVSRKDCKTYTGLDFVHFCVIVELLAKQPEVVPCKMDISHQIFLILTKLRQNYSFKDLGRKFSISSSLANEIFKFWLNKMDSILSEFVLGLEREVILNSSPSMFKENYPNTICVISKSKLIVKRNRLRKRKTCKFFVISAPSGFVMNVSKLYPIGISDAFIVQQFGLDAFLEPGDEIMTDWTFKLVNVETNFIESTDNKTKINLRKNVMGKIQQFKILKNPVPTRFANNFDKILRVCCGLCNFQS